MVITYYLWEDEGWAHLLVDREGEPKHFAFEDRADLPFYLEQLQRLIPGDLADGPPPDHLLAQTAGRVQWVPRRVGTGARKADSGAPAPGAGGAAPGRDVVHASAPRFLRRDDLSALLETWHAALDVALDLGDAQQAVRLARRIADLRREFR